MTAGYLAMSATVASDRVFESFLGDDLGERTLYHGHSYGGNALAAAVALRHLELFDAWTCSPTCSERSDELRDLLHDRVASKPAVREVRLEGLMGGVELAPPADGLRWGRQVSAAAVRARRAAAPDRRHRGADAAAHDHVARDPPDRERALRLHRRGLRPGAEHAS